MKQQMVDLYENEEIPGNAKLKMQRYIKKNFSKRHSKFNDYDFNCSQAMYIAQQKKQGASIVNNRLYKIQKEVVAQIILHRKIHFQAENVSLMFGQYNFQNMYHTPAYYNDEINFQQGDNWMMHFINGNEFLKKIPAYKGANIKCDECFYLCQKSAKKIKQLMKKYPITTNE